MILLLGGTSETAAIASALAKAGLKTLVSTATDIPMSVGEHPNISRRYGKLNSSQMAQLINNKGVIAIVDASHPYAASLKATARNVANQLGIPYLSWLRPPTPERDRSIRCLPDHYSAAREAFSVGTPVLLTTGSRNLQPYVLQAKTTEIRLVVRVLSHQGSIDTCRLAGIPDDNIVFGRGPFSVEENLEVIKKYGIGVLVTKDSGVAGGVPEKLEAARIAGCRVIFVLRPVESSGAQGFSEISELVKELFTSLSGDKLFAQ